MKSIFIILGLLICGTVNGKPADSRDAVVDNHWQVASIESWPLRTSPILAYPLTQHLTKSPEESPPTKDPIERSEKLKATNVDEKSQSQTLLQPLLPNTQFQPIYHPLQPLPLTQATLPAQLLHSNPYLLLNSPYYATPYTLPLTLLPTVTTVGLPTATDTTSTTAKPKVRDIEATTAKIVGSTTTVAPAKLQNAVKSGDFKQDARLLAAVSKINPTFVIEDIIQVPGKLVISSTSTEKTSAAIQTVNIFSNAPAASQIRSSKTKQTAAKLKKTKFPGAGKSNVKVESTGSTRTSGTIPQIPFGTYFLPYFSQGQKPGKKPAALILEPHSKAVVGNGGTAISTPISKAFLRKGVPTNVYFNPESVAIAGVGGKAHAQADLELDLVSR